jgi:hypothetical protein
MKLFSALEGSPTQKTVVIADLNPDGSLRKGASATRVEPATAIAAVKTSRRVMLTAVAVGLLLPSSIALIESYFCGEVRPGAFRK